MAAMGIYKCVLDDLAIKFGEKKFLNDEELGPILGKSTKQISYLRGTNGLPVPTVYVGREPHCSIYELARVLVGQGHLQGNNTVHATRCVNGPSGDEGALVELAESNCGRMTKKRKRRVGNCMDERGNESTHSGNVSRPLGRPSLGPLLASNLGD